MAGARGIAALSRRPNKVEAIVKNTRLPPLDKRIKAFSKSTGKGEAGLHRPTSVTVICRVVLIVHSIGLLGDLLALLVSGNDSGIALYSNPLLMGNSLVSIVCSIGMLKGMGWARYGYLLRTGALWIFPFFPGAAGGSMPLGFYILLILWDLAIIFFLYRPKANAFFALAWASSVVGDQELEKDN